MRVALGCVLVLVVGTLLRPSSALREPSTEAVAPILEQKVDRREPVRVFRALQDTARDALRHVVAFEIAPLLGAPISTDFALLRPPTPTTGGFGLAVGPVEVLTHVDALGGELAPIARRSDGTLARGRVSAIEPETGLALVTFEPSEGHEAPTLEITTPAPGELVVAAAGRADSPWIAPVFVTATEEDGARLSLAVSLRPGTPLFVGTGAALAVAASSATAYAAAPGLSRLHARARSGGGVPASIGVVLQALPQALVPRLGPGVLVADVAPGTPAERAGIVAGDLITGVGGHTVEELPAAIARIAALAVGRPANLTLRSRGRERTLGVVPEAALLAERRASTTGTGVRAGEVLEDQALLAAGVSPEAQVLAIEGVAVRDADEARRRLHRRQGPSLVRLRLGDERFFAALEPLR